MKLTRATSTLGLLALTALASACALADEASDAGWYGGFNLGLTQANINDKDIGKGLNANGFGVTNIKDDSHHLGYKLLAGYQFTNYFALEGGYFDLGTLGYTATTVPAGTQHDNFRYLGGNLDALGFLPINDRLSGFGRFGVDYGSGRNSLSSTGAVHILPANDNLQTRGFGYKFGIGLQYALTASVGLRAEAERYRADDAMGSKGDIDLFSVGALFRFGGASPAKEPAPIPEAPPPAAVVAPVVLAPVLVVVPIPVKTQQYCSILDIQFNIDNDDIQREDKEKLRVVGTFLNKYPDTTAEIEGHADNVGTDEYNMSLSQRRADGVVAYLVNELHIAPARLTAVGYGNTRPLADNSTEEGKRMNRRIDAVIACATDIAGLTVKPARMTMALEMEFDENNAGIRPEYDGQLSQVAKFLKANPNATATVEGHTGNLRGSADHAMEVSRARAQNVLNYLVDHFGIERSRLSIEAFGKTRRFSYNTSLEGQQENRRVNVIINYAR